MKRNNIAYHQLALEIRKSILSGDLKPGAKLPGEFALAEAHGVSRTTARLAIKELEKGSLVYRRQGAGTFVSATPNKASITRSNFTEFMKGLGPDVTREIVDFRWIEATQELASDLMIPARSALLWFKRIDRFKNDIMAFDEGWMTGQYAHLIGVDDLARLDFFEHWQRKQSITITKTDVELAAEPADKKTANTLQVKKGYPVLIESSTVFTPECGAAHFETRYKYDMYRFKRTFHYE